MATNAASPFRLEPAAIEQRVQNLEAGIKDLSSATASQINGLSQQISNLSTKLDERAKIPWPALGVMLSFLTIVGGLVWYPVKDAQDRQQRVIEKMADATVTQKDLDVRLSATGQRRDDWQRQSEERSRRNSDLIADLTKAAVPRGELEEKWRTTDDAIKRNQARIDDATKTIVPRGEHEEKWRGNDRQLADMQRQIDEIKKTYSELYSPRDALTNMQRRLDDIERRIVMAQQQELQQQRPRQP